MIDVSKRAFILPCLFQTVFVSVDTDRAHQIPTIINLGERLEGEVYQVEHAQWHSCRLVSM